jgi:RimJ/RimL family protein N-acetyltransferase
LVTSRLTLRPLRPSDAEAVFAYRSDPAVARFQTWQPRDVREVRAFIATLRDVKLDTPGTWYQLAITHRESGTLIGDCGLHFPAHSSPEKADQVEIGITLAFAHQRQGYAIETLERVLAALFVGLGKRRIYARVDPRNTRSIELLERVGMRKVARLQENAQPNCEGGNDAIYAILASEWESRGRDG